ncbi:hypothetical protein [Thermococcus waiotapuensis]|uniref:Uncharacterized protein n=1 Tax=Thermococcus waiotapuensis TaxID=90909 RepID=A0AAE4T2N8_9EURY|nr:hypothetical protein [Thermococcus waiotapuensis]MDV3102998.1 hypothetical protein [Thermococcus waiotapuensis]
MKRWSLVLPTLYFLFLFLLALLNIPREVSRPLTWIEDGGIVFMVILGGYLEGRVSKMEITAVGLFTILWLGLAFIANIKREYFVLLGFIIEFILVFILKRAG